ncbi:hypothetical protein [Gemmatimonas sp.]|uniref:hypothetical protein n=1 Tax=Gemmatimonas sp. TaxID=1962908 RepID=UPI0039830A3D
MARFVLPSAVQQLVWRNLPSIDHVAVLLAMRSAALEGRPGSNGSNDVGMQLGEVAERAAVSEAVAGEVLADLHTVGLLQRHGLSFVYAPSPDVRETVNLLAEMYNTRPVTLVRAIYDRPATSVQQFADAFRLRNREDS